MHKKSYLRAAEEDARRRALRSAEMGGPGRPYDPRDMRTRMPLGCMLWPLAIAAGIFFVVFRSC